LLGENDLMFTEDTERAVLPDYYFAFFFSSEESVLPVGKGRITL
jgi:hypothetical protein